MSDKSLLTDLNANYLEKVMDLSDDMNIAATEDIYDARGVKLVAKGTQISRSLQEKLILHRLRKPLESSIAVENGVNNSSVTDVAELLMEKVLPILYMCKSIADKGNPPLHIMKQVKFGNAMSMMLTITERCGKDALSHCVTVSLIAICLAKKLGLSEEDQSAVALGGLLHDIGELYVAPEYLQQRGRRLTPYEWRHVVVHSRIGQMLIEELEQCSSVVSRAVAEHHERFDGSGYPRHINGNNLSVHGQILSVAEAMAGVFMRDDRALERAELALKIIPGEHARELVSAISSVLRLSQQDQQSSEEKSIVVPSPLLNVRSLHDNLNACCSNIENLLFASNVQSKQSRIVLNRALDQAKAVKRSFNSTGLDICLGDSNSDLMDAEIQFEVNVASSEIQWRMRDIARNIALQSSELLPNEIAALAPLIQQFDQDCSF
jgi:putative nucleotidyltransferase with HDIG domain